ncbi:glycoside hydrolase [Armillaria fumosa]|nr:glycoside hydrolase [Armillaria fumosa]
MLLKIYVCFLLLQQVLAQTSTSTALADSAPTDPPSTQTGKTPALGWNTWNAYGCDISEAKVLAAANSFIDLGLADVGYEYINIDDCWSKTTRNSTTHRIIPDSTKFPNGISGVANQVHALGLKIGIYSDAGTATCAGFPGSLGMETIDAATFNEWAIDYLKYDNCNVPANWSDSGASAKFSRGFHALAHLALQQPEGGDWYNSNSAIRYRQMGGALAELSRPIQFSLCIWGNANVWDWGARVGHSWRMSSDSRATWSYITSIIATNVAHLSAIGFYAHNDMDMMEIGNGAFTIQEQRTHFAAWAFLKSPIILGTDLSKLDETQVALIKNSELLAFHQDITNGSAAYPFTAFTGAPTTSPPEYYSGTSSAGVHVFIINTSSSTATKTFTFSNVPELGQTGTWRVHDMWSGTNLSGIYSASSSFSVSVQAHDTLAYRITAA